MVKYWNAILASLAIFACGVITGGLVVSHVYESKPAPARAGIAQAEAEKSPVPPSVPAQSAPKPEAEASKISQFKAPVRQSFERIAKVRVDYLDRISRNLKLSDDQRDKVAKILRNRQNRVKQISDRIGPEIQGELRQANDEIRRLLTPEQRRRFERIRRMHLQQKKPGGSKEGRLFQRKQDSPPQSPPL